MLWEDFAWLLCRLRAGDSNIFGQDQPEQAVPGWSAFNGLLARNDVIRRLFAGHTNIPELLSCCPAILFLPYIIQTKKEKRKVRKQFLKRNDQN